ncbi:hypothetical protein [Luteibacter sp. OK325]|uniref:hypothetical protein n=1 Tax=Luteibacter sp. OK325 TaxID=2135670 RepID=UPI000D36DBC7|nr:hypothetical protein [Luteibacter sp. OK325]
MTGSSTATETVANHEETDRHRRKDDNEKNVQEFHGGIPSEKTAYCSPLAIFLAYRAPRGA